MCHEPARHSRDLPVRDGPDLPHLGQSVVSPVLTTSLYFVVFGAAIGSRIEEVEGVSYGAFIVPGLIMLTVLTAGDQQRILRHLFPEIRGHDLRASVGPGVVSGGDGGLCAGRRDQGADDRADHPGDIVLLRRHRHRASVWMVAFLVLTCLSFALFGFIIGIWAQNFEQLQLVPLAGGHAARVPWRGVLLDFNAAVGMADGEPVQSGGVSDLGLSLVVFRAGGRARGLVAFRHRGVPGRLPGCGGLDLPQRLAFEAVGHDTWSGDGDYAEKNQQKQNKRDADQDLHPGQRGAGHAAEPEKSGDGSDGE
jgi:hypothetical protein